MGFVAEALCDLFLSNPFFQKVIYLSVGAVQCLGELITQEYIPPFFLGWWRVGKKRRAGKVDNILRQAEIRAQADGL